MNRYRQGYLAELDLMKLLKQGDRFVIVLRSAGSRSPVDVVAVGKSRILLCQVKTGKGQFRAEKEALKRLQVPRCARKQIWIYRKRVWQTINVP
ncbi:MAG: hypothetical protein Q8R28_03175 [Dehalococcoidia bacterium]|nr:hypothetical protein [Dehalococcoidia bacterium]